MKLIKYKRIKFLNLPPKVWSKDDKKAMEVADFDFKSALAKERERERKSLRGRPPISIFRIYFHITSSNERTATTAPLNSGPHNLSVCYTVDVLL